MADNRNFVNKFANQGGGDIFVEDAKLSEISTKTAIASEGVMLKGTDGAYYEIDKASLSEVIRAELGAILADNSKNNGTSVGKVPTLNSSGNALGASSVADLASVLGGVRESLGTNIDLNTVTRNGHYRFYTSLTNAPFSNTEAGELEVLSDQYSCVQIIYLRDGRIYQRASDYNSNWTTWQRIDNYGTSSLSELASALGGVTYFGTNPPYSDMDDFELLLEKYQGRFISFVSGSMANAPSTGWHQYYIFYGHSTFEIAFDQSTGAHCYMRLRGNNSWSSWHTIW